MYTEYTQLQLTFLALHSWFNLRLGDRHFMGSSQKAYSMWTYMIISYMIISSGIQ